MLLGTLNQIPSTDEIMPDLNHSRIYNAGESLLNRVVRECLITNKVNKERD